MLFSSFIIILLSIGGKTVGGMSVQVTFIMLYFNDFIRNILAFTDVTYTIRNDSNSQISKPKSSTVAQTSDFKMKTSSSPTITSKPPLETTVHPSVSSKDPTPSSTHVIILTSQSKISTGSQIISNKSDSSSPVVSTVFTTVPSRFTTTEKLIDGGKLTTNNTIRPELNMTTNSTSSETNSPLESSSTDQYNKSSNNIEMTNNPKDVRNATKQETTSTIKHFTSSTNSVETSSNSSSTIITTLESSTKKSITLSKVETVTDLLPSEEPVKQTNLQKQTTDRITSATIEKNTTSISAETTTERQHLRIDKQTFCKDLDCGDGGKCVLKSNKAVCKCDWGRKGILCEVNLRPLITCVIVLASIFALVLILLLIKVIRQRRFAKWRISRFRSAKRDVYTTMPGSHRLVNAPSRSSKRRSDAGYLNLDEY
ncbi:unnamed protein product [Dimorphilus gyrociliatus]|uniref:EGF-like domain-containing protein n=1 Tax=Dimorphilus gyrociliatus TaxID=2664684 RepID=A0A7I8VLT3_9ANNE|nr:unnamed protein product [Dimorphilus gyrociliatus]